MKMPSHCSVFVLGSKFCHLWCVLKYCVLFSPELSANFLFSFFTIKFYLFIYLFLYFWLCWVFVAVCRLSLIEVNGGYSLGVVCGLLLAVASLVAKQRTQVAWAQ